MEAELLKKEPEMIQDFIRQNNIGALVKHLDRLGKLDKNFDKKPLMTLLKHDNERVRSLAIKNLAKIGDLNLASVFVNVVETDDSSIVRREAVSGIGRLRNISNKQILFKYLNDSDPEIVMQAMRGLLVFKEDKEVQEKLKKLINHPNEMIQDVIKKEFYNNSKNGSDPNHTLSPDFMKNTVVHGDVREILKFIKDESVHLTFTSPPYYNARDYSIYSSYKEYLEFLEEVFKEVHRITKEGRFFLLNTSPIIIPRVGRQYSSKRYPIPYDIHPFIN